MLDFSWSHILVLLIVALVVVGPKDLPRLMRIVGQWMGKARAMADQFRKSFDDMARQAELDELRKEIESLRNEKPLADIDREMNRPIIPDEMRSKASAGPQSVSIEAEPEEIENRPPPRSGELDHPREGEFTIPDPPSAEPAEPVAADGYKPPNLEFNSPMNKPTEDDEAAIEATKAPLMDHLIELRKRLIWSILTFVVCFLISFYFAKPIYAFLTHPLYEALKSEPSRHMIATALTETFFVYVKVGMFAGLCLAFPIIAAQLWLFVAPGLYKHERNAFLPFLAATPVMFALGFAFVFYIMLPNAIRFFVGFDTAGGNGTLGIELQAKVSEYLDFVMTLIFAFGLCFQLPVLLSLLGRVGIIGSAQLRSMRRYAIVGMTAVAAVLTPPDIFSMMSLAVPLWALYEVSVLLVWLIERDRTKKDAAASAAKT